MNRLPSRAITLLYLAAAHLALVLAFGLAAWRPDTVAGFFYHPRMAALVHLVTLGWITFSIFGAFFIVGPLSLRIDMRARRADYAAFGLAVVGLVGMAAHFWIERFSGMAWSAATIGIGAMYMAGRIAAETWHARVPLAVRLHVVLACANFWLAAGLGLLLAVNKVVPVLPGFVLSNVFAHAHMAAVGWATMMVVGVGYRLLPMVLPSKMPSGPLLYASVALLEAGVLGLFTSLLLHGAWSAPFGLLVAAGIAAFVSRVAWMLRHPAPRPAAAPRVDFAIVHAAGAGLCLVASVGLGVFLTLAPLSTLWLRAAAAYGVLGLIGFLAQMIVAMEARLLPLAAWCWAYAQSGYTTAPLSPHRMHNRGLQALVFAGWALGVPALAAGMALASPSLVGLGAASLAVAVGLAAVDNVLLLAGAHAATGSRRRSAGEAGRGIFPAAARTSTRSDVPRG
ncbi:MAG TPA: hypothetical protein VNI83_13580 [Vicinamibacterales bacterium]|nr:hypothetical protein [Vicinamibacterales bacterium]